jgi:plasmid stabilization system protein ParE
MAGKYKVVWTREAKKQVDGIIEYLRHKWTQREVEGFLDLLYHFENLIASFPKTYKESAKFKGCRLGLVHQHVTVVYSIHRTTITILTVFDNRTGTEK